VNPSRHLLLRVIWRLSPWLLGIAAYTFGVVLVMQSHEVPLPKIGIAAETASGLILGVLLVFRNRAAFDRWWEGRRLWGQLINDTRNLAWKVKANLSPNVIAQHRFSAALAGFAEALKKHLRHGVVLQEIAGFAKDQANTANIPSYLAGHIMTSLADCHREGLFDGATALLLDPHARALLDICGACERIRNTEISPSYKSLLRLGIVLSILAAPWYMVADLGFLSIPSLVGASLFLLAIELVDTDIEEPFGTEPDDLDLDRYCQTIRQSVVDILGPIETCDSTR
jgi:ion channel-forming bestrophin family protein